MIRPIFFIKKFNNVFGALFINNKWGGNTTRPLKYVVCAFAIIASCEVKHYCFFRVFFFPVLALRKLPQESIICYAFGSWSVTYRGFRNKSSNNRLLLFNYFHLRILLWQFGRLFLGLKYQK